MTPTPPMITYHLRVVLWALVHSADTSGWTDGTGIIKRTGLRRSTVYKILAKLSDAGWIERNEFPRRKRVPVRILPQYVTLAHEYADDLTAPREGLVVTGIH